MKLNKLSENEFSWSRVLPVIKIALIIFSFISVSLEIFSMEDIILEYEYNFPDIYEDCSTYGMYLFAFGFLFFCIVFYIPKLIKVLKEDKSDDMVIKK